MILYLRENIQPISLLISIFKNNGKESTDIFVCFPNIEFLFVNFPYCAYECREFLLCWKSVWLFSFLFLFSV
jgi:hypothetical protein